MKTPDKEDPKKGWHFNYCIKCKSIFSKTSHFGGKKEINCKYCDRYLCLDCFVEEGKWPTKKS